MTRLLALLIFCPLLLKGEFFKTRISELRVDEEHLPLLEKNLQVRSWSSPLQSGLPIARFQGFAFVVPDLEEDEGGAVLRNRGGNRVGISSAWLVLELKEGDGRKGFLDVWNGAESRWVSMECEIDAARLKVCDEKEGKMLLAWHDQHRLEVGSRGGLWYRGRSGVDGETRDRSDFGRTFSTLSGGRALAENLALDRDLILGRGEKDGEVPLSGIKGVTVESIPWEEWMPKGEIKVDVPAMRVPEDQHFLVVPGLKSLFGLMERVEKTGTPIVESFAAGSDYRGLPSRYRSQMGLDLPETLARLMPVGKVAVTGGDPFYPTGSDVAVILETTKVDFVYAALRSALTSKAGAAGAEPVKEDEGFGFENGDRSFSSHLMKLEGAVVVSNSRHQLARLRAVAEGKAAALGASGEYRFFRHRYPMGGDESAYVFISDACLRRWAGPEVRIGASRRNRALSALATVTAKNLLGGELDQEFEPLLGKVKMADRKVLSENYGSLAFVTPVGELGIETVSTMEKEGYERWRRGYESGWSRFFDPIAIQLRLGDESEEMDMTILPLRVDSDYEEVISLAGNATLSKEARKVPGESVFHFAMAVDKESDLFKQAGFSLVELLPSISVNPFGWMGESVSVTLGDSLVWQGKMEEESLEEMPVLVRVDVESRLKLALFMTAVKGAIATAAPGLVDWETRKHGERKYVVMTGDEDEVGVPISIYYATMPTALLVSLNEEMLKRAMDREEKVGRNQKAHGQVMAQTTPGFLVSVAGMDGRMDLAGMRKALSYQALPVLNEWRKAREAEDPVEVHAAHFARILACPGGMGYQWNAKDLTMESVAYGHPGSQRDKACPVPVLERFQTMKMEASFEQGGMRMKLGLEKESSFKQPELGGKPRPADDEVVSIREFVPMTPGTEMTFVAETQLPDQDEPDLVISKGRVNRVTEKDGALLIEEIYGDPGQEERVVLFELGPKGFRLVRVTGAFEMEGDPEAIEYPAEVWVGQKFRVKKSEILIQDGKRKPFLTDAVVTVAGWETVEGPEGKMVKVLRLDRSEMTVFDRRVSRESGSEWFAPGLGMVKRTKKHPWGIRSRKLTEFKKPE